MKIPSRVVYHLAGTDSSVIVSESLVSTLLADAPDIVCSKE
jgi:hypothetical protein